MRKITKKTIEKRFIKDFQLLEILEKHKHHKDVGKSIFYFKNKKFLLCKSLFLNIETGFNKVKYVNSKGQEETIISGVKI